MNLTRPKRTGGVQTSLKKGGRAAFHSEVSMSGGRQSREKIARICGLSARKTPAWRLESVRLQGNKLRLWVMQNGTQGTIVLYPGPLENYFARAGEIDICFEGKQPPPALSLLMHELAKRLRDTRLRDMRQIVEKDPESIEEKSIHSDAEGMAPDAQGVTDRLGGNPGQWRRFFCHREFERPFHWAHPTGFSGRILYFVHGDFDCTFMPPDVMYRGMNFINYPPLHPHSSASPVPDTAYEQWASDLRSKDIILGTRNKVDAFVDSIRKRAQTDDLVMVSFSCVPTMIGDDEGAMQKACREAGTAPVLINSIRYRMQNKSFSLFEDLFSEVRTRDSFKNMPRDPEAINVLDCQPRFAEEELKPLMREIGARINTRIFPEINVRVLNRYLAAASQIVPTYLKKKESVVRALSGLPLKTVYSPAPYGIEGTRSYIMAAARSIGKEKEAFEAWAHRWEAAQPRWETLHAEARRHRLAFVAEESTLEILLRDDFVAGIPVPKVVGEMGFNADFLIYAPGGKLPGKAQLLTQTSWFGSTPKIHPYRNPEELKKLLEDSSFSAVYSDIFFDYRLTCAGKAQFSMRTLESGLEGALRSLERLLDICRLPFYKKYRQYLQRVPRGQDV